MIYRKNLVSTLIILFLIICTPVFAAHVGKLEYNDVLFDYSKLNQSEILKDANIYFSKYNQAQSAHDKVQFGQLAMSNYYILTKIEPVDIYPYIQLARIYMDNDKKSLAKSYLSTALNIEMKNPYTNYYCGEYFFKYHDYKKAVRHYMIAYNNGYAKIYDLNLKLAIIYEKLGDLVKAVTYYQKAILLSSENEAEIQEKIHSLIDLNYDQSEYYKIIRE